MSRLSQEMVVQRKMAQAEHTMALYEEGGVCEIVITGGYQDDDTIRFTVGKGYVADQHTPTLLFLSLAYEREFAYPRSLQSVAKELRHDLRIAHVDGCFVSFSDTHSGMRLAIRRLRFTPLDHSTEAEADIIHKLRARIAEQQAISVRRRAEAHRMRLYGFET